MRILISRRITIIVITNFSFPHPQKKRNPSNQQLIRPFPREGTFYSFTSYLRPIRLGVLETEIVRLQEVQLFAYLIEQHAPQRLRLEAEKRNIENSNRSHRSCLLTVYIHAAGYANGTTFRGSE